MVVVVVGGVLIVPWWYLKKWDISWRDDSDTQKKEYE